MKCIHAEVRKKIEDKIASLEQFTSCEFVCVFRQSSINVPRWLSWLFSKRWRLRQVETAAHLAFLHEEIFATQDRTGIMIFISERERAVYVMADKGVTAKIPASEFGMLGQNLAKDFSQRSPGETFLTALDDIAKRLGKDFPPRANDKNELSNRVR